MKGERQMKITSAARLAIDAHLENPNRKRSRQIEIEAVKAAGYDTYEKAFKELQRVFTKAYAWRCNIDTNEKFKYLCDRLNITFIK